jgi:hypothetical protein
MNIMPAKILDGADEIIFSNSFNVYDNSLKVENILGINITFLFDEEGAPNSEKDIDISGTGTDAMITFSTKLRNTLGSGTTGKIEIAELDIAEVRHKLFFSLYASKVGDNSSGLNLNITFYTRKI